MSEIIFKLRTDAGTKEVFRVALNGSMLLTITGGEQIVWETSSTEETLSPGDTVLIQAKRNEIKWRYERDAWGTYALTLYEDDENE